MAAPRLPSLYPHLFKASRGWEPPQRFGALSWARDQRKSAIAAYPSGRRSQSSFGQQRYGQAAEPMNPSKQKQDEPPKQELLPALPASEGSFAAATAAATAAGQALSGGSPPADLSTSSKTVTDADTQPDRVPRAQPSSAEAAPAPPSQATAQAAAQAAEPAPPPSPSLELAIPEGSQPMERVLQMDTRSQRSRHPHLEPPPYVHHFDTYTLVRGLGEGGFTQPQSVTLMKAVRSLLAVNMELARDGLVSKSDVENESYLFRAATSELRTEVQNSRQSTVRSQRSDLAHLQHDTDILAQKMTQELTTLRDELRGMFDDRKMSVRVEQRHAVASIEDVNRGIQVHLLSEGKGRIEALRWSLAKRAVTAIVATAAVGLLLLRVITNAIRNRQQKVSDREAQLKAEAANLVVDDSRASYMSRPMPAGGAPGDSDEVLASAKGTGKDAISYVTLG